MGVRIVGQEVVAELLPMSVCMRIMTVALQALARGEAVLPLRPVMPLPDKRGALAMMPAWLGDSEVLGLKVISYFPGNLGTPFDTHQGAVLLFDPQHGQLLAIVDASSITAIRTAAVSGVATRVLSRPQARSLAILGSGVQARSHLPAMLEARPFEKITVWSRNTDNANAYKRWAREEHEIEVEVAPTVREAVLDADVVCTVTSSREPILEGKWLANGAHVNAVGSSVRSAREVDTETVVRSRVFVDSRESALAEAGDVLVPLQEGAIGEEHIQGELGSLLLGRITGRRTADEVTLFESLGIAIEDLAAAEHVYRRALATGAGIETEFGGWRS
jgi:ornithine cyclodeaminase/alanine dehydrogenase-like protein (mu-crystallin family)